MPANRNIINFLFLAFISFYSLHCKSQNESSEILPNSHLERVTTAISAEYDNNELKFENVYEEMVYSMLTTYCIYHNSYYCYYHNQFFKIKYILLSNYIFRFEIPQDSKIESLVSYQQNSSNLRSRNRVCFIHRFIMLFFS
jgi:hypothetical protein